MIWSNGLDSSMAAAAFSAAGWKMNLYHQAKQSVCSAADVLLIF